MKNAFLALNIYQRSTLIFLLLCLLSFHLISFNAHFLLGFIQALVGCALTIIIASILCFSFSWKDKQMLKQLWKPLGEFLFVTLAYCYPAYLAFKYPINIIFLPDETMSLIATPIILSGLTFHIGAGLIIRKTKYFQ